MLPDRSTWDSLPKTQAAARDRHIPHFFTGQPCGRGHINLRKASSGNCIACDRLTAYQRRRAYHLAYRKATTAQGRQSWQMRKRFTPPWQTPDEAAAILAFYAARPDGMVVDHRIPFEHDDALVVGLHVPANLCYATTAANVSKGGSLGVTRRQAAELVRAGLAIWRSDVSADFSAVDWEAVLRHREGLK